MPAFLIAASLPFAVIVWHAGALEPSRHGLVPSVFLRLGALLPRPVHGRPLAAGEA